MSTRAEARAAVALADLVELTKPRLTSMVLLTTAGGMLLAPGSMSTPSFLLALLGTALTVSAAHSLNMLLERDLDGLMERTKRRPLPAGRMAPIVAQGFGISLAALGLPVLALGVSPLVALLAAAALVSYVGVYTPLKRRSPAALFVGTFPGAIPPVMGWVAATGTIDPPAVTLFGILVLWQIPHFIGLSLLLLDDYRRAGVRVFPLVHGTKAAQWIAVATSVALLPVSWLLVTLGVNGLVYGVGAVASGLFLLGLAASPTGGPEGETAWGRKLFFGSLIHLTVLFFSLVLDVALR